MNVLLFFFFLVRLSLFQIKRLQLNILKFGESNLNKIKLDGRGKISSSPKYSKNKVKNRKSIDFFSDSSDDEIK